MQNQTNIKYSNKNIFKSAKKIKKNLTLKRTTGKRVKGDDDSAIKEHLLFCSHTPHFEDFSILATNSNDFKVTLTESLLINRDRPPLNKNKQSLAFGTF